MKTFRFFLNTAAFALSAAVLAGTAQAQGRGSDKDKHDQGQQDDHGRGVRGVPPAEQKQREDEQRARDAQYRAALDQRVIAAQHHAAELDQQHRSAMAAQQAQYLANLREQQQRLQAQQRDYRADPYYTSPLQYRYRVSNTVRTTNQYGADQLRQAVNVGYQQGYQSGRADKQDGRRSSYSQAYGYQDANYGYNGNYVAQTDYNYYFRQGFSRGYADGYANATRYGSFQNGAPSILGTVLTSILGLTTIH